MVASMHKLRSRVDRDSVMKISDGFVPHEFASLRPQRHDGIIKSPDEHVSVPVGNAVVVPPAAQKERGELRLIAEAIKPPQHLAGGGIESKDVVVAVGDE